MKQAVTTAAMPRFRPFFFRQSLLLSVLFIVLNSVTLLHGGQAVQTMDVVRLVISSVAVGCLGAVVTWFLKRKKL
jgi:membrane protein YqaA with SNARE-associated domain